MSHPLKFMLWLAVVLAVIQAGWHYAHLPERVATHFNLEGQADGWSSRGAHFAMQAGLAVCLGLLFGNTRRLMDKVPDRLINIPHREYWLAPERRAASLDAMQVILNVCAIVFLGFLMLVFQQVYRANLDGQMNLKAGPLIIGLFVFVTGLVIIMMFRFRKPEPAPARGKRRR